MRTNTSLAVSGQQPSRARSVPAKDKPRLVPNEAAAEVTPVSSDSGEVKGYFVEADGIVFAGRHLIIDLWDAKNLDSIEIIDAMLREATAMCGATLLDIQLHHFGPNCGVSGVALLAESHISIHTWPERGYAAVDLFMCGACNPYNAIPALKRSLEPGQVQVTEQKRGIVP